MIKATLLMGGSGQRFGAKTPKQFHHLSGKPIYLHTLERFLQSALFDEILLVCHRDWMERVESDILAYSGAPIRVVAGGSSRQASSYLGLLACSAQTEIVVIHDAVRPFVSIDILRRSIEAAKRFGAVDTCIPSTDTLVHTIDGSAISSIPKRSEYVRGQTPQTFSYPLILKAHQNGAHLEVTDDCTLALQQGHPVHIVRGDETNMKITSEIDLTLAEQLFLRQKRTLPTEKGASSIRGKVYAITGGTGGIGSALSGALKAEGAHGIALGRSDANLVCYDEAKHLFNTLFATHGPLDGLINCIGLLQVKTLSSMNGEEIEEVIGVNLTAVIACCQLAKIKEGGHILNIASSSYSRGRKGFCVYSAAKAGVVNFTQGLAEERTELYINALAPQRTNTALRRAHFPDEDPSTLLTPDEVAAEALSILKQTGITGTVIDVRKKMENNVCATP